MISTIFRHCVFGHDHWTGKNPSLTSFIYSSHPSPPIYQERLHVISHPTNQTLVKTQHNPERWQLPPCCTWEPQVWYRPGDPAGLEQGLGVRNIQGDFIVHLRIRITELKERSQESEAPSSTVSRAASFISCCCGSTWIYIYIPLADEGLFLQEESSFLTVT